MKKINRGYAYPNLECVPHLYCKALDTVNISKFCMRFDYSFALPYLERLSNDCLINKCWRAEYSELLEYYKDCYVNCYER